jgi:hypothetical protein
LKGTLIRRTIALLAATSLWLGVDARAQDALAISGKIEAWLDSFTTELGGVETTSRSEDVNMDIRLKWAPAENVSAHVKLDVENSGDDGDLLEEAYVTVSRVGSPDSWLDITIGKKELKYGQGKFLWETFTFLHGWAEIDGVLALEFGVRLGDRAKLYVTNWLNSSGTHVLPSGDFEPNDNFLFQSHALKGEIKLADGVDLNVSYLNRHDESMTAAGQSLDEKRFSVGVSYSNKEIGLTAFAEYIGVENANFNDGEDGSVVGFGLKCAIGAGRKLEVGLKYDTAAFRDGGVDTADESAIVLGLAYNVAKGTSLVAEYVSRRDDVAESAKRGMSMGFICRF